MSSGVNMFSVFRKRKKIPKTIVFILTHELHLETVKLFQSVKEDKLEGVEVKILLNDDGDEQNANEFGLSENEIVRFKLRDIKNLKIPMMSRKLTPGSHHMSLYYAYTLFKDFDYYWLIEYDVRFSGPWKTFFEYFSTNKTDLIGTHFASPLTEPEWRLWKTLKYKSDNPNNVKLIRSFFPIIRLSNRALNRLIRLQRAGWWGHSEVLIPTLIKKARMSFMDIGGEGEFTRPSERNRFYPAQDYYLNDQHIKSTFRFRPLVENWGDIPNTLYHPVKYAKPENS